MCQRPIYIPVMTIKPEHQQEPEYYKEDQEKLPLSRAGECENLIENNPIERYGKNVEHIK